MESEYVNGWKDTLTPNQKNISLLSCDSLCWNACFRMGLVVVFGQMNNRGGDYNMTATVQPYPQACVTSTLAGDDY